jgi:hypothetical protein
MYYDPGTQYTAFTQRAGIKKWLLLFISGCLETWHVKILWNSTTTFLKVWLFYNIFLFLLTVCFHLSTRPCIPNCPALSSATGARCSAVPVYWNHVIAVLFQTPLMMACVVCKICVIALSWRNRISYLFPCRTNLTRASISGRNSVFTPRQEIQKSDPSTVCHEVLLFLFQYP